MCAVYLTTHSIVNLSNLYILSLCHSDVYSGSSLLVICVKITTILSTLLMLTLVLDIENSKNHCKIVQVFSHI